VDSRYTLNAVDKFEYRRNSLRRVPHAAEVRFVRAVKLSRPGFCTGWHVREYRCRRLRPASLGDRLTRQLLAGMSALSPLMRMLCSHARVNEWTDEGMGVDVRGLRPKKSPIFIDDTPGVSVQEQSSSSAKAAHFDRVGCTADRQKKTPNSLDSRSAKS
jgi:hypothetical protein